MYKNIPVNTPLITGNAKKYLLKCINTGWISSEGNYVKIFEKKFAKYIGKKFGVSTSSGTAAIEIAISALKIKEGDEVILPAFTIISCILPLIKIGAKPVLVDSDPINWNMDINQIENKITKKTKAIIIVHTYGLAVDVEPILKIAKKYNLKIIEDAAEAHGLKYKNNFCGFFGDISIFSFYSNKLVTTGEGGMILTNNNMLADKCRSLRNLCFNNKQRFVHTNLGWNYRMSNLQAALGLSQLEQINKFIKKKKQMGKIYNKLLKDIDIFQLPLVKTKYCSNIYWVYGIVINNKSILSAKSIMLKLTKYGIGSRPFFYPMNKQPIFKKMGLFKNIKCPVAERISKKGFYIPSGLSLTLNDMKRVSSILHKTIN